MGQAIIADADFAGWGRGISQVAEIVLSGVLQGLRVAALGSAAWLHAQVTWAERYYTELYEQMKSAGKPTVTA